MTFPSSRGSGYTAVRDVDFAIPRGRFVSVVGPTGCGKSTVLNAVAGLRVRHVGRSESTARC
ncbi:ATP-binding cassette domain-containing protein [Saccharopolyspora erythraea]|uniref:ABC transporter domain-containing protein n=2 Tax=Saccharopolyspora erythraea TaxID=1836 RepID=A0ABN1CE83_SACER|nr:ATP-binding cassette domain-containing protein [Saccharopolyspora erythraea]